MIANAQQITQSSIKKYHNKQAITKANSERENDFRKHYKCLKTPLIERDENGSANTNEKKRAKRCRNKVIIEHG